MKKFESAYLEIIYFDISDVVCTSGNPGLTDGGTGEGDNGDYGEFF